MIQGNRISFLEQLVERINKLSFEKSSSLPIRLRPSFVHLDAIALDRDWPGKPL
jgi:hypothetical protein